MTWSPSFSPLWTTQSLPSQAPVSTGTGVALPSRATHTMRPCSVCMTADCGTL